MRIIAYLMLLTTFSQHALGQTQDDQGHDWNLGIGYQNARIYDRNVSPLIYSSNNGIISATYLRKKQNKQWNIGLNLAAGSSQSKRHGQRTAFIIDPKPLIGESESTEYVLNPGLSFVNVELSYTLHWKINSNEDMRVGFGLSELLYYGGMGADTWFFNQISIMPSFQKTIYKKEPYRVDIKASLPLLSHLLRQPYSLDPSLPEENYLKAYLESGSSIATINEFQQLNAGADFIYQLGQDKSVGLSWLFTWMNYSNIPDRNLKYYSNSFVLFYQF